MPRDGSGIYTKSSASFVAGTTIVSANVNADFDDLVTDANAARPITAGGTAATTPIAAFDKLSAAGADIASAATLNLDTATGPIVNVTGAVTVTAVTLGAGKTRIAKATGAFQLTASATLVVNKSTSINYTTTAGDLLIFEGESGLVRVWVVPAPAAAVSVATVVSAATTLIGAALSSEVNITGTVTITAFDSVAAGTVREGYFSGALTLTHNGTSLILPGGANITTAANDRFKAMSLGGGNWIVLWYTRADGLSVLAPISSCGQFVTASTTVVKFIPFNGNVVSLPSGKTIAIPSAGVSATITSAMVNGVAAQTLSVATLYYAYLALVGGVPTIDFSTTGHSTDANSGIEIKTGDATRVLIGMVYPQTGPIFASDPTKQLVASWFNRTRKQLSNNFTANRATASASLIELNTEIRSLFLSWGDALWVGYNGSISGTVGGVSTSGVGGPSLDGSTTTNALITTTTGTVTNVPFNGSNGGAFLPSEGFHYITMLASSVSGTATWISSASGQGTLSGVVYS